MHPTPRHLASLLSTAILVVLAGAGAPVIADDTEIFVAEPPPNANTSANIMFIIDTSGSMDGDVVTQTPYDPGVDYDGDCNEDRVYWAELGDSAPRCSGRGSTDEYIDAEDFLCQASAGTLNSTGLVTVSYAAQWRSRSGNRSVWEAVTSGRRGVVDCKADAQSADGPDGAATGDGLYPITGSTANAYGSTSGAAADGWWNGNGRDGTYTFYTGNYLNYLRTGGTVIGTRLEVVQDVTVATLDRLSNVNVGLTIFNNEEGGRVIYPMTPIEDAREEMKTAVRGLVADGFTPLSETMYEVFNYWAGLTPQYSGSDIALLGTGDFKTPLGEESCGKNYNVLLTDGEPTRDTSANNLITSLSDLGEFEGTDAANPDECSDNSSGGENGQCLDDIAKYMYSHDLAPTSSVIDTVVTYTVGFGEDVAGSTTLERTADAGGGKAYEAIDSATLTDAFETIIREIISKETSFTAPAVSVNAFNRTQNLSDLFITVFQPSEDLHWPGNLKKYNLRADGTIEDANRDPAVNESTGFFTLESQSFWSEEVDGPFVAKGGAAKMLPTPAARKLYTDFTALAATTPGTLDGADIVGVEGNQIDSSNTLLTGTAALLGLPSDASSTQIDDMITWIRGGDVDGGEPTQARFTMGDPLHARPVSVIYGGTPASPNIRDAVVFAATNDGYLHAIHPNGVGSLEAGGELWSFVPSELLPRMFELRENDPSVDKGYGLDGNIVAYKLDVNHDGIVDPDDGDRVLLYFGMGRGGNNYYAFDVTDKAEPKFLWRRGRDDVMPGLGQTWSTPIITRVKVGDGSDQNDEHLVMLVGGGYDPSQDAVPYNRDSSGNRIFMLDAITGDLLWHAGPTDVSDLGHDNSANFKHVNFTHSIPADLRVLDLTNDGYADRMYVADTGGQVWRFDIRNGNPAGVASDPDNGLMTGGIFASLGNAHEGSHPTASSRRFYNAPDTSLMRVDGRFVINVALGSGYRGHPINDEIQDRFYSLRDKQPFQAYTQAGYGTLAIIEDDTDGLVDVTGLDTPTVSASALGWKMLLNQPSWQGEKVLTESRTFNNKILFSTFTPVPSENEENSCVVSGVKNTFYAVNALNGEIIVQNDLQQTGIAPTPVILFPPPDPPPPPPPPCEGDDCPPPPPPPCVGTECTPPPVCLVGLENCGVNLTNTPVRTFWTQQNTDTN